ncbi:twin-arginine translocase subunit TatB [Acidisoma cellulosilytica]|uniref:Twin-arginine translocase subunit TatB n=1 Tax=Acidisoma cellulosilyticum TaxID=2802395 RepID=A0A963Z6K8_9PROT|nr:twin-arginine translocase subunit TatB [Acidisoma cellulosilyticum]MCB8883506.1 twin-arginine translocase subunit TatB [Acidisoma cellulosilyticum]
MFDFLSWAHIAVIAAAALIFIGPKDMPVAIRSITGMIKKARKMAGEFQGQMDDLVKEANLHEVRDSIAELRGGLDVRKQIGKMIDPDRTIRSAFEDPMTSATTGSVMTGLDRTGVEAVAVGEFPEYQIERPEDLEPAVAEAGPMRPSFVPPTIGLTGQRPAFIPPGIRR